MKTLVQIIVFCSLIYLGYVLDKEVIDFIIGELPKSINEWVSIINIGLWCLMIFLTGGLIIGLSTIISTLVGLFFTR